METGTTAERRFGPWGATSLMVGAGGGAGIMAVPWLAARVGLLGLLVILPIAWAASALVHLMLAEVAFRTGRELQIVELMRCYVFRGRLGRPLLWAVFGLLALAFLANLAAYVAGAAEIVATLAGAFVGGVGAGAGKATGAGARPITARGSGWSSSSTGWTG